MPLTDSKQLLTVKDLVAMGYGSRSTITRDMRSGKLPYIKFGNGRVRFRLSDIQEALWRFRSEM